MRRIWSTLLVLTLAAAITAAHATLGVAVGPEPYYDSSFGSSLVAYAIAIVVVSAGVYFIPKLLKKEDSHYRMLRDEVRRNEAADKGGIEEQTRALLDDAVRLEEEASTLENANATLAVKVVRMKEAIKFWKNLIREDEDFIFVETHDVETK